MKKYKLFILAAAFATFVMGCEDLEVENLNAPDRATLIVELCRVSCEYQRCVYIVLACDSIESAKYANKCYGTGTFNVMG